MYKCYVSWCAWVTVYGKTFEGETFMVFAIFCSTANDLNSLLLAIGIHYQKELLPRKFSCEHSFSIITAKVSPQMFCRILYNDDRLYKEVITYRLM